MKFKLGGADLIFSCAILFNIKNDKKINLFVVKGKWSLIANQVTKEEFIIQYNFDI